ncbi:MAG: 2-polyprenyl-3-methyl-5-hydroxy-6-metoxy-1,4-benzoquinol methylase [Parasphingorhabdus sp.]
MSPIIDLNGFIADQNGILSHPDSVEHTFSYSDGSDAERYLLDVFSHAEDLGSDSVELQLKIKDWPSEYHLTSKRANLFRPFKLDAGARVLELGCGCGAITRYLAEQDLQVDAIEGSSIRARLAKMRCRDKSNANIIQANFNKVQLPESAYDYVTLIGVIEYARMFSAASTSDRQAVVDILAAMSRSLKPGGRILIAIENRTAMKYLHGAHEDHYSKKFVGIDNYSEPAGIRTFTRREWCQLAQETDFSTPEFYYPFPDYKIPEVILSDAYMEKDANAWCHLEGIHSSDYTFLFDPYIPETISWQGYNAAGVMADMANSFFLVLTKGSAEPFSNLDFAHLPDFRRKREHCKSIIKNADSNSVLRQSYRDDTHAKAVDENYLQGMLLSSQWARTLLIHSDRARFASELKRYREFLQDYSAQHNGLSIDLLPNNIVVSEDDVYQVFDQEWQRQGVISIEYVLFRALLVFANHYRPALRSFCRRQNIIDVEGFIRLGFACAGYDRQLFSEFCQLEDSFQTEVLVNREGSTQELLTTPLQETPISARLNPTIFWAGQGKSFTPQKSSSLSIQQQATQQTLKFEAVITSGIQRLRFDPCDENRSEDCGNIEISAVRIIKKDSSGLDDDVVWSVHGASEVIQSAHCQQLLLVEDTQLLTITGDDPHLVFTPDLNDVPQNTEYYVEIDLRYDYSRDYSLTKHQIIDKYLALSQKVQVLETRLAKAKASEQRLRNIQQSFVWRLITRMKRLIRR